MRNYAFRKLYKAVSLCLLTAAALSLLSGCTSASAANGGGIGTPSATARMPAGFFSPTPEVTQEPTPEPTEYVSVPGFDKEAAEAFAADELKSLLNFDLGLEFDTESPFADEISAHKDVLLGLDAAFTAKAEAALRIAAKRTAEAFGVEFASSELEGALPGWRLCAAAAWACGGDAAARLIKSACAVSVACAEDKLKVSLSYPDIDRILAPASPEERFTADFVYSYFLTVFDDEFEPAEHNAAPLPPDYVRTIGLPLRNMFYYDSWYGPRQYSTRYHLGMDIHAAPDASIFSCTDGTVKAVGFDEIAGYYVVVTDPEGYEYHYYHMIRQTEGLFVGDCVLRGDLIGNVGSTGNSDGYHLHLSIITPEHIHLNPYTVMCAVRDFAG